MNVTFKLTADGLIRALQMRAHGLADRVEAAKPATRWQLNETSIVETKPQEARSE